MMAPAATTTVHVQGLVWVEVLRGLSILTAVLIHVTGRFLRDVPQQSLEWFLLAMVNRVGTFAVPTFLTLTTLLLGLSLRRRSTPGVYARTRLVSLVWPFFVWTMIFLAIRLVEGDSIGGVDRLGDWFIWGKASFHLYYLAVALQLALLMPILTLLTRNVNATWIVVTGLALTIAVYLIHRAERFLPFPGSSLLWYLPAVTLGLYLLAKADTLETTLRRLRPWALIVSGAGLIVFLPPSLEALRGGAVNTVAYQFGHWTFTTAFTIYLAALTAQMNHGRWRIAVEVLGRYSLQIYLMHPLVLLWLHSNPAILEPFGLPRALIINFALALLLPLGVALLIKRLNTSAFLFGR